jgi:hypothetical protein
MASHSEPPFWVHFSAGTIGGIFGLTICYPLDTVKVRVQTQSKGEYRGVIDCAKKMVQKEGALSLYRGLLAPVVGYGLIKATAFASYNEAKQFLRKHSLSTS